MRVLGGAGVLLLLLGPGSPSFATEVDGPYVAQGLWSAKHVGGIDRLYFLLRDPWLARPTGEGVRVALVDTGIDPRHPDLAGSVVGWRDFISDRPEPYDDHGHGTHVAAVLAGRGHLQWNPFASYWLTGARGVAPDAKLLVAKAMRADGTGDDALVARAVRWALDPDGDGDTRDGAHVISLSLGIESAPGVAAGPTHAAVASAIRAGVVVVASSGNDGLDVVAPPANVPGTVVVGALETGGGVAPFSNSGPELDLVAPGVLVSAYPGPLDGHDFVRDGYTGMAGTSMAAPFVAGVVALMLEADPSLRRTSLSEDLTSKVASVEATLKATARPLEGARGGAGVVDAYGAVRAVDRGTERWDPAFLLGAFASGAMVLVTLRRRVRLRALAA